MEYRAGTFMRAMVQGKLLDPHQGPYCCGMADDPMAQASPK
jgi:hypothetical protein